MTRLAVLLMLAMTLTPVVHAQSTMPPAGVWTVHTTLDADVKGGYATVHVIADIANRGRDPEFPFRVQVPDDALVTGLTITRDGETFEAQIAPRDAARTEYEQQKSQGQTTGLVEKQRHSATYEYLINVADRTSVRAVLTYEEHLVADRGVYNLSMEAPVSGFGQDTGATFHVAIADPAGIAAAWGTPDAQASRAGAAWTLDRAVGPRSSDASTPFTASYALAGADAAGGSLLTYVLNGTGYFAHRIVAPPDAARLPVDMVLVLDVSGSMSGLKIAQLRDAADQVVRAMESDDTLHLVIFSSSASSPWSGMRAMDAAGRAAAEREIDALLAGGGTNIEAALKEGFAPIADLRSETRLPLVAFLTDGQPTVGATSHEALLGLASRLDANGAPVYTVAFGADADYGLLHALAMQHQGAALQVPEGAGAEVDLRRFLATLATPTLRDITIDYGPGVVARAADAPVLLAGSERLVVGTFDPALGMGSVTVRAVAPDGPRSWTVEPQAAPDATWLPRLVAYQQVRALQDALDAGDAPTDAGTKLRDLGLAWHFVTDETSLVLALEPAPTSPPPCDCRMEGAPTATSDSTSSGSAYRATDASTASPGPRPASATPAGSPVTPTAFASPQAQEPPERAPSAQVPGPSVALVLVGLAAVALLARRRR
jgi:uncharacterized protein YegL